jgi:hypothetical protein
MVMDYLVTQTHTVWSWTVCENIEVLKYCKVPNMWSCEDVI